MLHLVGYLYYWQMGFNSVFKGLNYMAQHLREAETLQSCIRKLPGLNFDPAALTDVCRGFLQCVVGITTRYWLDGPGIKFPVGGEIFRTCPYRPWGPRSLLYDWYRVFPWDKAAGTWRSPPTPPSAEFKGRIELCIYSLSGSSLPVLG